MTHLDLFSAIEALRACSNVSDPLEDGVIHADEALAKIVAEWNDLQSMRDAPASNLERDELRARLRQIAKVAHPFDPCATAPFFCAACGEGLESHGEGMSDLQALIHSEALRNKLPNHLRSEAE